LDVAEQRKGISELFGERRVVLDAIEGNSEDFDVALLEIAVEVAEPATLFGSTGRVRLRVEPEDHCLATVVGEAASLARVVKNREIGSLITGFEHQRLLRLSH